MAIPSTRYGRVPVLCALVACSLAAATASAGGRPPDARRMDAMLERLEPANVLATEDFLRGDLVAGRARLEAVVDRRDWVGLLALGNMAWVSHPAESLAWHQQAYALSRQNDHVLLELAYHHTRRGECTQAVDAWARLDAAGMVGTYMPMLAGYCHLVLGQDAQAFAMFERARIGHSGRFEHVLGELWGPAPAPVRFARHVTALRAGGEPTVFFEALELAITMDGRHRGLAMATLLDGARPHADRLGSAVADLDCLRPAFEREAGEPVERTPAEDDLAATLEADRRAEQAREARTAAWAAQLRTCRLLLDAHPLPSDSRLAWLLASDVLTRRIATAEALLARHGRTLDARARSAQGDLPALRLLAALQVRAKDAAGLAASDELGWTRYREPRFAASRVIGELVRDEGPTPEGMALLTRARADFPDDAYILEYWLRLGQPTPEQARAGWRELALRQFRAPTGQSLFQFGPSASTLMLALRKYREAAGL